MEPISVSTPPNLDDPRLLIRHVEPPAVFAVLREQRRLTRAHAWPVTDRMRRLWTVLLTPERDRSVLSAAATGLSHKLDTYVLILGPRSQPTLKLCARGRVMYATPDWNEPNRRNHLLLVPLQPEERSTDDLLAATSDPVRLAEELALPVRCEPPGSLHPSQIEVDPKRWWEFWV